MQRFPQKGVRIHMIFTQIRSGFHFKLILMILVTPLWARANNDQMPDEFLESAYDRISGVISADSLDSEQRVKRLKSVLRDLFDFKRLAPQIIPSRWAKLSQHDRDMFTDALTSAFSKRIMEYLAATGDGLPRYRILEKSSKERVTIYSLQITGAEPVDMMVYILQTTSNGLKISDLKTGKRSLRQIYYNRCKDLIDDYSFAYMVAELSESGYVVLEDFEGNQVNTLPAGWEWKSKDNDKNKPYTIKIEGGNKYLQATDEGESVIMGKDIKWNIKKYPYISFRWRAHKLPPGGDERYGKTVDSAAGIYFTCNAKLGLIPESVKYVWSTTLPVGSAMRRSGIGKPWMVVADSGDEHLNKWRTHVFNLYEAYKKTFGDDPPDKTVGVGILSDANSVHAKAYADYDDFRALKEADAGSGVLKILEAE